MSYQHERDQFIARMTQEGLPFHVVLALLRAATTLNRYAELACSSEAADRDRVACPAKRGGPCLCDCPTHVISDEDMANARPGAYDHQTVPRIAVREWNLEQRVKALMPCGWTMDTQGDPRGYVLRVIPPSYAQRNVGRDRFNRDVIGVPSRESGIRW